MTPNNFNSFFNENKYPVANAVLRSILYWVLFIGLLVISSSVIMHFSPNNLSKLVYGVLGTLVAVLTTWIFIKIEKKTFRDIGLFWDNQTLSRFVKGFFVGLLLFAFIILTLLIFTSLQVRKNETAPDSSALLRYIAFIPLALMEEIAFRSYPFLKLNKALGLRITQLIVAIAFALYHVLNGWGVGISFLGPGIWAFVFGLAAIWSGGIAVPTGIHVALNVMQTFVGIKGSAAAFFILEQKKGASAAELANTNTFEIIVQLLVLVGAVLFMEYFIRRRTEDKLIS